MTDQIDNPERATVLIVDDEEDIRFSFVDRFEERYRVLTAADGAEALEILRNEPAIAVVVTDVRMPRMTGLELIRGARLVNRDLGFIVVSGHADAADVIQALRAGARNFLRKPYSFEELEETLANEVRNFHAIRQSRQLRERGRDLERLVVGMESVRLRVPTDLGWVNPLAFRLAAFLANGPICGEDGRLNVALALIEMLTNAMEHGNMEISGAEKAALKHQGEAHYFGQLQERAAREPYCSRHVHVTFHLDSNEASFEIRDEGPGFDTKTLPDPEDATSLFAPSGRGILLARAFLDEVTYNATGTAVRLVKRREPAPS